MRGRGCRRRRWKPGPPFDRGLGRKTGGRTRRIQTREGGSVWEVGKRHALEGGAATHAAPEYPQPKWGDWGEEESLEVSDLASPPQHPLATRGRDHRGPSDQSRPSVSLVSVLAIETKEARHPRVPGGILPCSCPKTFPDPRKPPTWWWRGLLGDCNPGNLGGNHEFEGREEKRKVKREKLNMVRGDLTFCRARHPQPPHPPVT